MRLDYGPETEHGRTVRLPAAEGETYPALVSDVDADGNERAGIRLPDLSVPLATHTGWNLRHEAVGNPDLVIGITGGLAGWTLPFAATRDDREAGDPRPSIDERYSCREEYLRRVRAATQELIAGATCWRRICPASWPRRGRATTPSGMGSELVGHWEVAGTSRVRALAGITVNNLEAGGGCENEH